MLPFQRCNKRIHPCPWAWRSIDVPGDDRSFLNGVCIGDLEGIYRLSLEKVLKPWGGMAASDRKHLREGGITESGFTSMVEETDGAILDFLIGVGHVRSSCSEQEGISNSISSCWFTPSRCGGVMSKTDGVRIF